MSSSRSMSASGSGSRAPPHRSTRRAGQPRRCRSALAALLGLRPGRPCALARTDGRCSGSRARCQRMADPSRRQLSRGHGLRRGVLGSPLMADASTGNQPRTELRRSALARAIALLLILALATGLFFFGISDRVHNEEESVIALQALRAEIVTAESSVRGYTLAGRPQF